MGSIALDSPSPSPLAEEKYVQAPGASAGLAQAWGQGGRTERAGLHHGARGAHGYEDG